VDLIRRRDPEAKIDVLQQNDCLVCQPLRGDLAQSLE